MHQRLHPEVTFAARHGRRYRRERSTPAIWALWQVFARAEDVEDFDPQTARISGSVLARRDWVHAYPVRQA